MASIGLVQTRGLGDIVIAAPIAQYYIERGDSVYWPIDSRFLSAVERAFPTIRFLSVDTQVHGGASYEFFYGEPLRLLQAHGCEIIYPLYSYLSGLDVVNEKLAKSLKFDEYKYAVAQVPFDRKWTLKVTRDSMREAQLEARLGLVKPYVLLHEEGSNFKLRIELPADVTERFQIVRMETLTDSPFDWIGVMEKASMLVCVDSCFANLAEQMNLCSEKYLMLRSDIRATPVFKNGWKYC
jgi:hypothetical protein